MVERARKAQVIYDERFDQERVDQVIKAAARTIFDHAEELARLTIDETQMGVYEDKVAKNRNKSKGVWYNLKGKKSMGILSIDERTNYRNSQTYWRGSRNYPDDKSRSYPDV